MLCRLYLAAMHFNENAERPQRKTAKGKLMYRPMFLKAKRGGYTVKQVKTETTICYVLNLMQLVFKDIIHDPVPYVDAVQRIPVPEDLCAQLNRPSIEDAVAEHVSRFSRGGGLNLTYCPEAFKNALLIHSTMQEGITTWTLLPRKPQHQLTKVL
ncbi:hypothetical protein UPYG_G00237740 [Umbra pygmaea]|uniref:Uncharacterized protein n=1 Tax=Umbra pygmaea TaxID=75934 RepID=A0ABD0WJQ4_UMBPY